MIVGISGKKGSGKNTSARYIIERYGGYELAFADPLKRLARDLIRDYFGEDVDPWADKTPKVRRFLQVLGTDLFRAYGDDVWVKAGMRQVVRDLGTGRVIGTAVFTDVRFPNEANAILDAGGVVLRCEVAESIRRERLVALYGDAALDDNHPSETALDDFARQIIVRNDDVHVMRADVDRVFARLGLRAA
jgi:hypothetical protein